MHDLIQTTDEVHYETFRTARLVSQGKSDDDPNVRARKAFESKMKDEESQLRKRFTEEVRKEEQRFRVWEHKVYYFISLYCVSGLRCGGWFHLLYTFNFCLW